MSHIFQCYTERYELGEGYYKLMFFKAGENDGVVHRGPQDLDTLMAFVYKQMGRTTTIKVS